MQTLENKRIIKEVEKLTTRLKEIEKELLDNRFLEKDTLEQLAEKKNQLQELTDEHYNTTRAVLENFFKNVPPHLMGNQEQKHFRDLLEQQIKLYQSMAVMEVLSDTGKEIMDGL